MQPQAHWKVMRLPGDMRDLEIKGGHFRLRTVGQLELNISVFVNTVTGVFTPWAATHRNTVRLPWDI